MIQNAAHRRHGFGGYFHEVKTVLRRKRARLLNGHLAVACAFFVDHDHARRKNGVVRAHLRNDILAFWFSAKSPSHII